MYLVRELRKNRSSEIHGNKIVPSDGNHLSWSHSTNSPENSTHRKWYACHLERSRDAGWSTPRLVVCRSSQHQRNVTSCQMITILQIFFPAKISLTSQNPPPSFSLMSAIIALPGYGCFQSKLHPTPKLNLLLFSSMFLLILFFLSTFSYVPVFAVAPPPAKIQDIWPRLGSLAGGTYLVIRGVGWTRGGMPGSTRAFINNKECIQNQGVILDSTDTNFVCWTPPLFAPGQEHPDPVKDWWAANDRFVVRVEMTTGLAKTHTKRHEL